VRPDAVRIDDLAAPRLPDEILPIIAMLADGAAGLDLGPDAVEEAAREQTGLSDFGDPAYRPRLEVLCRSLREEAGLSPAGLTGQFSLLTGLLKNRLLVEDLIARHPAILDVEITAPIVICGLPRTGTTHLHNLLSADPALRSLPYWESLEPVLPESERGLDPDPRLGRTEQSVWFINTAMPYFKRMHEMTVDHVHEEIQLLAIDVSTMLFETTAPIPQWRDHYLAEDQRPSYRYLKRILQALQWLRGGERWVLKSPQHLEQFPVLLETFPDATFVVTHRDPVAVTASMGTMVAYSARMSQASPDPVATGRYWADRIERMLRQCVTDRDVLGRSIDVRFDDLMADDEGMIDRIYQLAGQPMTAEGRAGMRRFADEHPRGRYGAVIYDLEELGLDRAERRRALAFYSDRFGVRAEDA
jgi:hypothetical protein